MTEQNGTSAPLEMTAMHPAFQLDEIVSLIATQVAATKCADVVKLARACRTLAKPALDILWSNYQHDFLPLIMCLPRDCFMIDDDGFESLYVSGFVVGWGSDVGSLH